MNCRTAVGMVNRYINHMLSVEELGEFLDHIRTCSSCYEELETYFIVHEAMQQLDDEEEEVLDFRELLEEDIKKSRHYILKVKFRRILALTGICLLIAFLAAVIVFVVLETR